jgi:hypothetical protein
MGFAEDHGRKRRHDAVGVVQIKRNPRRVSLRVAKERFQASISSSLHLLDMPA